MSPAFDDDDEIVPSRMNVNNDPMGNMFEGYVWGGVAVGEPDGRIVCNGKAPTRTGENGATAASARLAAINVTKLARALFA
jgi:hypothetical protein